LVQAIARLDTSGIIAQLVKTHQGASMPDSTYPGPETIHRHVLENGLILLTYENYAAESFVLDGLVRAGALAENREKAGLTRFMKRWKPLAPRFILTVVGT
jgi:hypothetical protein